MAYKHIKLLERNPAVEVDAMSEPESIMLDLDDQLAAKLAALGAIVGIISHNTYNDRALGHRVHVYLVEV